MEKEGLQAAIDYTKFLLTLAGGGIAFVIQPTFFANSPGLKALAELSLIALTISAISGLLVFSRGALMLGRKNYDLEDIYIKQAGRVNVLSFAAGFILLSIAVAIKVFMA